MIHNVLAFQKDHALEKTLSQKVYTVIGYNQASFMEIKYKEKDKVGKVVTCTILKGVASQLIPLHCFWYY